MALGLLLLKVCSLRLRTHCGPAAGDKTLHCTSCKHRAVGQQGAHVRAVEFSIIPCCSSDLRQTEKRGSVRGRTDAMASAQHWKFDKHSHIQASVPFLKCFEAKLELFRFQSIDVDPNLNIRNPKFSQISKLFTIFTMTLINKVDVFVSIYH